MRMVLCINISPNMVFKTSCLAFLVILVCASAVSSSDEIVEEEKVIRQLGHILTGEMQKDKVEMLSSICEIDLTQLVEDVAELDVCLSEDRSYCTNKINSECLSLARENIWRMLSRLQLHPCAKQTLQDCLKMLEEKEDSKVWYSKKSDPIFPKPSIKRRNVGSRLLQSIAEVPASTPLESPFSSPEISPSPDPSSSFPPSQIPASSPNEQGFQPSLTPPPLPENVLASPSSGAIAPAENKGKNHKPVIIAVVVTASVTFIVAALLFLCCTKFCKGGSRVRKNDERPLLSLSMSDFSVGASPNFYVYSSSIQEGKPEYQLNISNQQKKYSDSNVHAASNGLTSVQGFQANEAFAGVAKSNIESLGGLGTINGQAMPTLKPPPGRIQVSSSPPLPPLPASSFKAPTSNVGPPPPRPPAPPPQPPSAPPPPMAPPPKPPSAAPLRPLVIAGHPPGPPPLPPPVPTGKAGIHAPPPPKMGVFPPRPPQQISLGSNAARPSKPPLNPASSDGKSMEDDSDAPKAKLKPFFWDKVLANPSHSMVWHQIKSGSFQFNEEMIESLFGYAAVDKNKNDRKKESSSQDPSNHYIQIIDSKKAQNLSILLRALNVTKEEICDAIIEGNELHAELIQNLLKMAPTAEEEMKLRLFSGEVSQLGLADRFLKALVNIPFAFKRLEALHFMCTLQEDATSVKESFTSIEVACQELKNSRLFLKLLEAVLKTGNRMNDGTFRGGAQAFKLDTLLKLSDVKGTDGKTTLLLFVVQEIIRSEGARAARAGSKSKDAIDEASLNTEDHYRSLGLQAISGLGNELENVKRAAGIDLDGLRGTVAKLGHALAKTREFLNTDMKSLEENSEFHRTLESFVQNAEVDIMTLVQEEKRIMNLVKSTGDYFHGNTGKDEGLRLFLIVRDFLIMVDKACREVSQAQKKTHKKTASSPDIREAQSPAASSNFNLRLFPAIRDRRIDNSSSDEDNP